MTTVETKRYGWFEYRFDPFEIANFLTDQRLEVGNVASALALEGQTYKAIYSDNEISQAICFAVHTGRNNQTYVTLDYRKSLVEPTTYAYWRRLKGREPGKRREGKKGKKGKKGREGEGGLIGLHD